MKYAKQVGCGEFVKRQTAESKFSHFINDWGILEDIVNDHFLIGQKPGYKEGVLSVTVPPHGFFSGVIQVNPETKLTAVFQARREGEAAYIQVTATGKKIPAECVEVILYHHDVIEQDGETPIDAEWEIVSINARCTVEQEPMSPMAMVRNFLELTGGTKAEYTAEEFAKAILYWSDKAMAG